MNFNESILYLQKLNLKLGSRPGLSRIKKLLQLLGNPENALPVIHVTGTNGKGSLCKMLSSMLSEAHYKVGVFTSPYLTYPNEEIFIGGSPLSKEDFAENLSEISEIAETMEEMPTEFELLTALSFFLFRKEHCDLAIVEVGMGGMEDATNVISSPLLSVITSVSLDHCHLLGNTVEEIAEKKAGIIKEGRPVLYLSSKASCPAPIMEKAKKCHSPLVFLPENAENFKEFANIPCPFLATYEETNQKRALFTLLFLMEHTDLNVTRAEAERGLSKLRLPGRFEKLLENPPFYYDGAHNKEGMEEAVKTLKKHFPSGIVLLMGVMADKDYPTMVKLLSPYVHMAVTVKPENPRSLDPKVLTSLFISQKVPSVTTATVKEGVTLAIEEGKKRGLPVVSLGTLYLYKEVSSLLSSSF